MSNLSIIFSLFKGFIIKNYKKKQFAHLSCENISKQCLKGIEYLMNRIWFVMMLGSICFLFWSDPSSVLGSMIEASNGALKLSIELCGVYAVWLGILEIVDASGLGEKLAKLLRPLIKRLFKLEDPEAEKMIALNMSANMLGLGNAATPMGISAMKRLDDGKGVATPAIIMLIVINATSIQLLPSTVIGLRASAGSTSPGDIILPTLLATLCTFTLGICLVKLFGKVHEKIKARKK